MFFQFGVKGESDAHIMLTNCDSCQDNGIEIVIGGWSNKMNSIKRRPGSEHLAEKMVDITYEHFNIITFLFIFR